MKAFDRRGLTGQGLVAASKGNSFFLLQKIDHLLRREMTMNHKPRRRYPSYVCRFRAVVRQLCCQIRQVQSPPFYLEESRFALSSVLGLSPCLAFLPSPLAWLSAFPTNSYGSGGTADHHLPWLAQTKTFFVMGRLKPLSKLHLLMVNRNFHFFL